MQTPTPAQLPYLWDVEVGRGNVHMPRPAHLLWEGLWDQLDGLSLTGPVLTEDTPYPTGPTHTPPGHPRREFSHNQLLTTAAHPHGLPGAGVGRKGERPISAHHFTRHQGSCGHWGKGRGFRLTPGFQPGTATS